MVASRGCDESAMAEFFALCQSGDAGYNDGMNPINKLLQKETGGWEKIQSSHMVSVEESLHH